MKNRIRTIAIAAIGLAGLAAQAFQGEQNPLPPTPFQPVLTRAEVRSEAARPLVIGNGGTGVGAPVGQAERAQVRAGARAVAARGAATYGEH